MHSIALPVSDGEGLIATILPVGEGRRSSLMAPWSARWAVFSQNPTSVPQIPGEAFARLYGPDRSELRVVLAVAPGLGIPEAAELLGLGKETVKKHLQRAFEKTGTKRQAELARLLMASSPPTQGYARRAPATLAPLNLEGSSDHFGASLVSRPVAGPRSCCSSASVRSAYPVRVTPAVAWFVNVAP
jgi:DNA-binding CsgD family transcriptional regulator